MTTHMLWQHALPSLPPPSHTQWTLCLDRHWVTHCVWYYNDSYISSMPVVLSYIYIV